MPHSELSPVRAIAMALVASVAPAQWAGEWKFDETTGTTAADSATKKNDGTLRNFSSSGWGTGRFKGALTFDGADDYVALKVGNGLPVYTGKQKPYTIAFWVKAPAQVDKRVYSEGSNRSNTPLVTFGSGLGTDANKLRLFFRNDAGFPVINTHSKAVVFDGKWHHVAFVDATGITSLYIDGVLDSSDHYIRRPGTPGFGTFTLNQASAGGILRVGTCCHLKGTIDDLRVYEFAARSTEVRLMRLDIPTLPRVGSVGLYGVGCNGRLDAWAAGTPTLGQTLHMSLAKGTPGAAASIFIGVINPFDLSQVGIPGCTVYPDLATSLLIGVGPLDAAGGRSPIALPIPNVASASGVVGGIQGLAIKNGVLELAPCLVLMIGK